MPFLPAIAAVAPLGDQYSSSRCGDDKNNHQSPQKAIFVSPTYLRYTATPLLQLLFYFSVNSPVSNLCRREEGKCSDLAEAVTSKVNRRAMCIWESHLL